MQAELFKKKKKNVNDPRVAVCSIMFSLHIVIVEYGIGACSWGGRWQTTRFSVRLARHLQRPAGVRWSVKLISQNSAEEANRRVCAGE